MKPKNVHSSFSSILESVENEKEKYVVDPSRDFTRKRSISLSDIIRCLITMSNRSLNSELREFFLCKNRSSPTESAFIQQRCKLKDNALQELFYKLNQQIPCKKKFKGYSIFAVVGSTVNIPSLPGDDDSVVCTTSNEKVGYQYHINALFDLCGKIYQDFEIQPSALKNEAAAFCQMIDRHQTQGKSIYIADRGYVSFNVLYHVLKNNQYILLRAKELESCASMFHHFVFPDKEQFSLDITFYLTRSRKRIYLNHPESFKCLRSDTVFDGIPEEDRDTILPLSFRIVKIKLSDNSYEYLITNLPKDEFGYSALRNLYHMRWGIETSFRFLKYTIGLNYFHSKKRKFILQEIQARFIAFNIAMMIARCIKPVRHKTKYRYVLSLSDACVTVRYYLLERIKNSEIIRELQRYVTPIRPGRSYQRTLRAGHVMPFNNRS